ncbi:MAG: sugar ABC transporter permease [Oscillospiraceae bacterium]|nr:sugar ABC transporter permease [Oscillospiraceae bacterium]
MGRSSARERSSALNRIRIRPSRRPAEPKKPFLRDVRDNKQLYLLLLPFCVVFLLMFVIPIAASMVLSLTYYNMFNTPKFIGLANYINLFLNDDVFFIALKNTLLFAVITGPLSYLLCFFAAWLINEMPKGLRVFLTFIFYAPSLTTSVYFVWQLIFSGDSYGIVNGLLMNLGLVSEPVQWLTDPRYNLGILIVVQLWMSLGTSFLAFIAGFQSIDASLYEAGDIDGVRNRYQELLYITLPSMKPQLLFGAVMQISASFSVSTISQELCGFPSTKYSAHTILLHMQDYGSLRYEMGYACAIAVVLFVLMFVFKKGVSLLMRRIGDE